MLSNIMINLILYSCLFSFPFLVSHVVTRATEWASHASDDIHRQPYGVGFESLHSEDIAPLEPPPTEQYEVTPTKKPYSRDDLIMLSTVVEKVLRQRDIYQSRNMTLAAMTGAATEQE